MAGSTRRLRWLEKPSGFGHETETRRRRNQVDGHLNAMYLYERLRANEQSNRKAASRNVSMLQDEQIGFRDLIGIGSGRHTGTISVLFFIQEKSSPVNRRSLQKTPLNTW
jgi:hypothetical protein